MVSVRGQGLGVRGYSISAHAMAVPFNSPPRPQNGDFSIVTVFLNLLLLNVMSLWMNVTEEIANIKIRGTDEAINTTLWPFKNA